MRTKAICIALTLILCLSVFCTATGETGLAEHRDDCYSFSYPADWKEGTARDGSTILEVPDPLYRRSGNRQSDGGDQHR